MEPIATSTADVEAAVPDRLRKTRLALAVAWTLTICVLCWTPREVMRHVEEDSDWFRLPNFDKVVHCGLFVAFAVLWARAGTGRRKLVGVAIAGIALAIATELGQELPTIGRDATIGDALTDLLGLAIGLGLASRIEPMFRWAERLVFGARSAGE